MKYTIKVIYDTGDSFHNEYDVEGNLEMTWENLEIVEDNLNRIQEHYLYNKNPNRWKWSNKDFKAQEEEAKKKDWYNKDYPEVCLMLKLDDGTMFQQSSFWAGYFERLKSIEVVEIQPSRRKIVF